MSHTPGRWQLLAQAAYDARLDTARRIRHLDIALPKGYDQAAALQQLKQALDAHERGAHTEATNVLEALIDAPPMTTEEAAG